MQPRPRSQPVTSNLLTLALLALPSSALAQQPYDDLDAEAMGLEDAPAPQEAEEKQGADLPVSPPPPVMSEPSPRYTAGIRVGGGYTTLRSPHDPAGVPTLLQGTAFSGPSLQLGLQAGMVVTRPSPTLAIGFDLGLLYGWMRGTGFAENDARTKRQSVTLTAHMLRLPLLLALRTTGDARLGLRLGVGPEFLVGLASGATVRFEQIDAPAPPLYTTPTRHVGVLGLLGLHYRAERFSLPVELRFTWDPQVGDSTVERFEDYQPDDPGAYEVAFDLHIHLTTGVEWQF